MESILVKGKGKITGKLITCNLRFGNVTLGQSDVRHPRVDGNFCGAEARFRGSLIKLRHTPGEKFGSTLNYRVGGTGRWNLRRY